MLYLLKLKKNTVLNIPFVTATCYALMMVYLFLTLYLLFQWRYESRFVTNKSSVIKMHQPQDAIIRIDIPGSSKTSEKPQKAEINILCFNLTPYSELTQFSLCALFVFTFYLAYGYFVELIFSDAEVKPVSLYMTLVQFLMTMALSFVESLIRNPIKRK